MGRSQETEQSQKKQEHGKPPSLHWAQLTSGTEQAKTYGGNTPRGTFGWSEMVRFGRSLPDEFWPKERQRRMQTAPNAQVIPCSGLYTQGNARRENPRERSQNPPVLSTVGG